MSSDDMVNRGELERLAGNAPEIRALPVKAQRRIKESENPSNYSDTRFETAYTAILHCATSALRAEGYRVTRGDGFHIRTIERLQFTIRLSKAKGGLYPESS